MKWYAGIGSRATPPDVQWVMTDLARRLAARGWGLRSGGARGADLAFEAGAARVEIFGVDDVTPAALELAKKHHPAWRRCGIYVRRLMARNAQILLGRRLDDPVRFVVCWTPDETTGGTAHALKIARSREIPVRNLADPEVRARVEEWLRATPPPRVR